MLYEVITILSIYTLTPSLGIYGVAIGAVTGALFHLLIQYPLAVRLGFRPSTYVDIKHQGRITSYNVCYTKLLRLTDKYIVSVPQ